MPDLEHWIDAQASGHKPFAVLGDFNRDLRREPAGTSLWADIDDADPPAADLVNTAEATNFQNCMPSQTSAASSITSSWAAKWRADWCQTRSDASFTDRATRSAASCQITARYS